jgi:hypothetical protein
MVLVSGVLVLAAVLVLALVARVATQTRGKGTRRD